MSRCPLILLLFLLALPVSGRAQGETAPDDKGTFLGVLFCPIPEALPAHLPQLPREGGVLVTQVPLGDLFGQHPRNRQPARQTAAPGAGLCSCRRRPPASPRSAEVHSPPSLILRRSPLLPSPAAARILPTSVLRGPAAQLIISI